MLKENAYQDSELGLRLGHVHRLWRMVISHTVAPLGLTQPRWTLLVVLRHLGEGASQKQLADALGIELPSLSRTLAQLEKQGLVMRHVPDSDRRVREVTFTAKGRRTLEAVDAHASEARALLLQGIPDDERDLLHHALQRIEQNACNWLSPR